MNSDSPEDRSFASAGSETGEPLATWQPPRGRTYRIVAWLILIGFLLSVLGALLLMLFSELGLHRMS